MSSTHSARGKDWDINKPRQTGLAGNTCALDFVLLTISNNYNCCFKFFVGRGGLDTVWKRLMLLLSTNYTRQTSYVPKRQDCFESRTIWTNFCKPTPLDRPLLRPFRHKVDVQDLRAIPTLLYFNKKFTTTFSAVFDRQDCNNSSRTS